MEASGAAGFRPNNMDFQNGNISENWRRWKQNMKLVLAGPLHDKTEEVKVNYMLIYIGQAGRDIYNTWTLTEDEKKSTETLFTKFGNYCKPKENTTMARFRFNSRCQQPGESIDQFVTDLRNIASDCKYGDLKDSLIMDRLICATNNPQIQEKLLQQAATLTLDQALDIARSIEASKQQMSDMSGQAVGVKAFHKGGKGSKNKHQPKQASKGPKHGHGASAAHGASATPGASAMPSSNLCPNCGNEAHQGNNTCPARGRKCKFCHKSGHFVNSCRKLKYKRQQLHEMGATDELHQLDSELSDNFDRLQFQSITLASTKVMPIADRELFTVVNVDLTGQHDKPTALRAKVDTGAQSNALPLRLYQKMFPKNLTANGMPKPGALQQSASSIIAYGGHTVEQYGVCTIPMEYNGTKTNGSFYVTADQGAAIIGLPTSLALGLISVNCAINEDYTTVRDKHHMKAMFPDVFDGIGKLEGEYHITVDPSVPPVIHAPRKVPIALKPNIKEELEDMEKQEVITKVREGEPTDWVNSLVYSERKNGKLRICLDPKDLNRAIKRDHHVTPTLEEVLPNFRNKKVFSILDARCGYWAVQLDDESSYLTTFNSPFGRYRFRRMPFGLRMSQDVFQAKLDQALEGLEGVVGIGDDLVIAGDNDDEHDKFLIAFLQRCRKVGLRLNFEKCVIKQPSIKFYGLICNGSGIQPDPDKVSALKQMAPPTCVQELQSFLGMATYMSPFIKNASSLTAPLRDLTTKDSEFEWSASHQRAFDSIKSAICEEVTLAYFDPQKPITLQVDSSLKGLGAALIQEGKPVAFASKALTETESRYANIERELLAVVYGCERFHTYLYGQSFTVESDHKPLASIHLKHLTSAPPRLQRMLLRLQPYDLCIKYKPGKDMLLADALSRLSPEESGPVADMDVRIHSVFPQFTEDLFTQIRDETLKDTELNALRETVYSGWPESPKEVPYLCKPYWNFRDEIAIEDGMLIKGSRIIIPKVLQSRILSSLHEPHQGTEKTKLRARTCVYWNNINKDIDNITKSCSICQESQNSQAKEPLMQSEIPPRAWHTVGTDLFYLDQDEYLLISDYYSKYPFVRKIPQGESNSKTVANLTKQIFTEHGIPVNVRSDNGPHYTGNAFKQFSHEYGFNHITSSPHYARSNGFIESQVKLVKRTIKKAKLDGKDPNKALLNLRTTPIDNKLPSPAELLLGRQIQDNLPRRLPRSNDSEDVHNNLSRRQMDQKFYHDRNVRDLPPLSVGQDVSVQLPTTKKWVPGIVTEKCDKTPRSYIVSTPTGKSVRRNRSHLRQRETVPSPKQLPEQQNLPISKPDSPKPSTVKNEPPPPPAPPENVTRSGRITKPPQKLDL